MAQKGDKYTHKPRRIGKNLVNPMGLNALRGRFEHKKEDYEKVAARGFLNRHGQAILEEALGVLAALDRLDELQELQELQGLQNSEGKEA